MEGRCTDGGRGGVDGEKMTGGDGGAAIRRRRPEAAATATERLHAGIREQGKGRRQSRWRARRQHVVVRRQWRRRRRW